MGLQAASSVGSVLGHCEVKTPGLRKPLRQFRSGLLVKFNNRRITDEKKKLCLKIRIVEIKGASSSD